MFFAFKLPQLTLSAAGSEPGRRRTADEYAVLFQGFMGKPLKLRGGFCTKSCTEKAIFFLLQEKIFPR